MENEGDDKKSIWHSLLIGGGLLLAGGVLSALSDDTSSDDDLTNGQKLDLRETVESCQWEFDDEIEYVSVSDDTVWFTLEDGDGESATFSYSSGIWSGSYWGDNEAIQDAVDTILSHLN